MCVLQAETHWELKDHLSICGLPTFPLLQSKLGNVMLTESHVFLPKNFLKRKKKEIGAVK